MTKLSITPPSTGELNTVADPKVVTALQAIEAWANGNVGTNNIEAGTVTEAMLSVAVQTLLGKAVSGLTFAERTTSVEAANGELVYANKTGITITLPAPTVGRSIAVFCGGSATSVKVTCSSGKIYGDFTEGATTVTLATYQHLRVVASGEHWFIESGEPKREGVQKFKALTSGKAEEFSATRPVIAKLQAGSEGTITEIKQHTEAEGPLPAKALVTVYVQAGETITVTTAGAVGIAAHYFLL